MSGDAGVAAVKVVAVIPALDEVATVARVVREALTVADVAIVVDDGSTDGTAGAAAEAGAVVISHGTNRGVGRALSTGLTHARSIGADVVVQMDGDGQHTGDAVPELVRRVSAGADLVIGTRFESGFDMGLARRVLLRVIARLIALRIGATVSDPTSGCRAFSARAADELAPIFPVRYLSDTVEVLYLAHERDLRIETVPVSMRQRQGGTSSVGLVTGVLYTLRILAVIVRHSFRRRRRA